MPLKIWDFNERRSLTDALRTIDVRSWNWENLGKDYAKIGKLLEKYNEIWLRQLFASRSSEMATVWE